MALLPLLVLVTAKMSAAPILITHGQMLALYTQRWKARAR